VAARHRTLRSGNPPVRVRVTLLSASNRNERTRFVKPGLRSAGRSLGATLALLCAACGGGDGGGASAPTALPSVACAQAYEEGYTDRQSYRAGDVVTAYLHGQRDLPSCRLDISDVNGKLAFSIAAPLTTQAAPGPDASMNGFGWRATLSFQLPAGLASGVYLIEGKSPFVVKPGGAVDVLVIYPSNTANAYATSGGKSLYSSADRPWAVSFLRPIPLQARAEHCLRYLATLKDLKVGFVADADLDTYASIAQTRLLVIAGHSEYWTRSARRNFDRFVDAGGSALVLSGNTMWWQVRYTADQSQLVCFKVDDPEPDPLLQTITWNERSLRYPILASTGTEFPRGGYGRKADAGWDGYRIAAPDSPLLEGTGLRRGDILRLPTSEYDGAPLAGFDSAGYPMLDRHALGVDALELIGFDRGSRFDAETVGTFIVVKRRADLGTIVNVASNDWCSANGMGGRDGAKVQRITRNAIVRLLEKRSAFSDGTGG
jgi:hypothetical protein